MFKKEDKVVWVGTYNDADWLVIKKYDLPTLKRDTVYTVDNFQILYNTPVLEIVEVKMPDGNYWKADQFKKIEKYPLQTKEIALEFKEILKETDVEIKELQELN